MYPTLTLTPTQLAAGWSANDVPHHSPSLPAARRGDTRVSGFVWHDGTAHVWVCNDCERRQCGTAEAALAWADERMAVALARSA